MSRWREHCFNSNRFYGFKNIQRSRTSYFTYCKFFSPTAVLFMVWTLIFENLVLVVIGQLEAMQKTPRVGFLTCYRYRQLWQEDSKTCGWRQPKFNFRSFNRYSHFFYILFLLTFLYILLLSSSALFLFLFSVTASLLLSFATLFPPFDLAPISLFPFRRSVARSRSASLSFVLYWLLPPLSISHFF